MPSDFLGKTPEEALYDKPVIAGLFTEDLKASLLQKEIHYRDFYIETGDEIKWYNSKITPLLDTAGSPKGFTQRITDISEKKKVELAIEGKNRELKDTHKELKEVIERYRVIVQQ